MDHDPTDYFVALIHDRCQPNAKVSTETRIADFEKIGVHTMDFLVIIVAFQIEHRITLPPDLLGRSELSIGEFVGRALALPRSKDPLFVLHLLGDLREAFDFYFQMLRPDWN